jgi:flagellar biosynthesis protein FliQ
MTAFFVFSGIWLVVALILGAVIAVFLATNPHDDDD